MPTSKPKQVSRPQQVRPSGQTQAQLPKAVLRTINKYDPLLLLERMSQTIERRVRPTESVQPLAWWKRSLPRLPFLGLRSQVRKSPKLRKGEYYQGRNELFDPLRKVPGTRSICQIRSERRKHLFRIGIAGKNRRRSPGQGGHYNRTAESYYHCQKIRR